MAKIIKKKSHFFESFISKVLKSISEEKSGITNNAKQQFNSFICHLASEISKKALDLTIFANKKTISEKEVKNATELIISGRLAQNTISKSEKAVNSYTNSNIKGSRQHKASIIFSPAITEKFLRNFGYIKIMVTELAPIYLASILEYITSEILILSLDNCINDKRVRITIKDIEIVIKNNKDFIQLINKIQISFLGGGVMPYIHPSLLNKKKKKTTKIKNNNKHRFRPGTVALRDIKKYQKFSEYLIFSKAPFEKFIRQIFQDIRDNSYEHVKISKDVFIIYQHFIEQYIVNLLYNSNFMAIHAGRVKLLSIDIALISYLLDKRQNPYQAMDF